MEKRKKTQMERQKNMPVERQEKKLMERSEKSDLDWPLLQTLCSKMEEKDVESYLLTFNKKEKCCTYIATSGGEKFLSERMELIDQFYKFFQEAEHRIHPPATKDRQALTETFYFDVNDKRYKKPDKPDSSETQHSNGIENVNENLVTNKENGETTANLEGVRATTEKEYLVQNVNRRSPRSRKIITPSWTKSYIVGEELKSGLKHSRKETGTENLNASGTERSKNDVEMYVVLDNRQCDRLDLSDGQQIKGESRDLNKSCTGNQSETSLVQDKSFQSETDIEHSIQTEICDTQDIIMDAEHSKTENNTFFCKFCNLSFKWKSSYYRHMKNQHKRKDKIVDDLGEKDKIVDNSREKDKIVDSSREKDKIVDDSGESKSVASSLLMPDSTDGSYLDETPQGDSKLEQNTSKPFACRTCDVTFTQKKSMYRHFRNMHPKLKLSNLYSTPEKNEEVEQPSQLKFICTQCGKRYLTSKQLSRHLVHVHKVKRSICRICGSVFKTTAEIMKHYSSIHNLLNFKHAQRSHSHQCNICRKYFLSKMALENHKKLHISGDSVSYDCHHCGKVFSTTFYLSNHLLFVHKEKKSICRVCKEYFSSAQELRRHVLKHNACIVCNKTFSSFQELKEHRTTHSELLPSLYGLPRQKLGLNAEKKYFICKICNIKFIWKHSLQRHFINKHQGKGDQSIDVSQMLETENIEDQSLVSVTEGSFVTESEGSSLTVSEGNKEFSSADPQEGGSEFLDSSSIYKCSKCPKFFVSSKRLRRHLKQVHKMKCSVCKNCGEICLSLQGLNEHYSKHHNISKSFSREAFSFHCKICRKFFRTKEALKLHEENHSSEVAMKYNCHHCGKAFFDTVYLSIHLFNVHKEKCSVCRICMERFPSRVELRRHLSTHNQKKDLNYCNFCGKSFPSSAEYSEHKRIHHSKSVMCDVCGQVFTKMYYLNVHMRTHTGERPFKCNFCDKSFISNARLRQHTRLHNPEGKNHQCELCGMCFFRATELSVHKNRQHLGVIKTYKCDYCDREFKSQEGQNNHMVNDHAKLLDMSKISFKTRTCQYCGKLFAQKHLYDAHVMIHHTGKRPLSCDLCGKGFINIERLNKHRFTHSSLRRYTCEICKSGAGANDMSKLKKHFRSVKHLENCAKLGISEEEGKIFSTNRLPKMEPNENRIRARLDEREETEQCQVIQEVPTQVEGSDVGISDMELQTTECVIITLPENMVMACGDEDEAAFQIENETAVQTVIKMKDF